MIQYFSILSLLFLGLGCQRLDNVVDDSQVTCGVKSEAHDRLIKIEGDSDLDAVFMAHDGVQSKIQPTAKNCLLVPPEMDGTLYIREKENHDQGLSILTENLIRGLSFHSLSSSDHLVQKTRRLKCPDNGAIQSQVVLRTLSADSLRAHLPSARVTLFNKENQIISRKVAILSEETLALPLLLDEGKYRLSLENFDAFEPDSLEPGITCELTVDRSPPQLAASREGVVEVRPGQVLEFPLDDASPAQLYVCARKRENEDNATAGCQESEFLPASSYVVPEDSVWDLQYFAKDQAGNTSNIRQQVIAVFHRDTIEQIKLLSKEFQRLTATTTQQYRAFKTYQKLVNLAKKLTLKAEINEVYWKLLGNFATVSQLTLVSREKMPNGPGSRPAGVGNLKTVESQDQDYPYRVTIVRNGLQHELKIYDMRYPNMKPLGQSISADATENSLAAILSFHPTIPYLVYVAAGRFLLEFDLRAIHYSGSGDSLTMEFPWSDPYLRQVSAESVISDIMPAADGRLVTVATLGGWLETHALNSANQSLWPHKKMCGRGICRYNAERRTSVSFNQESRITIWQSDKDDDERQIESPVDIYDLLELDNDTVLLMGKDGSLYLWMLKTGELHKAGSTSTQPYAAYEMTQFHAVIIEGGDHSAVLRKTAHGWELLNQTFPGEIIRVPNYPLPVFKREDDGLQYVIDIYDTNFMLKKTMPVNPLHLDAIFVKDHVLYYDNRGLVERIDISSQKNLPPLILPDGYDVVGGAKSLVLKRWNSNDNAFAYFEWIPFDGSLMPIESSTVNFESKEGSVVDADGERFFLSPSQYFFLDEFHGVHLDRDDDNVIHKDVFTVEPNWFDEQLRQRPFYGDPE